MENRPIIFSTPMVQAILDGRKTQTRRVIKPQPLRSPYWTHYENSGAFYPATYDAEPSFLRCPYGKPGDRLWVRETFCVFNYDDEEVWYKASPVASACWHDATLKNNGMRWKPSIHMPKKYARIWLEITGVRVERLKDLSPKDGIAEGVEHWSIFPSLWDSINKKKHPWSSNPWVWVVEFRKESPC